MTRPRLSLRVEPVEPGDRYAWIISERSADDREVELVVSLDTYHRPSHAMHIGEKVLAVLAISST